MAQTQKPTTTNREGAYISLFLQLYADDEEARGASYGMGKGLLSALTELRDETNNTHDMMMHTA